MIARQSIRSARARVVRQVIRNVRSGFHGLRPPSVPERARVVSVPGNAVTSGACAYAPGYRTDAVKIPKLGARVDSPSGLGTITDRDTCAGEVLVRLDNGTILDTDHGRWFMINELSVIGFDPDASVWFGTRMRPASEVDKIINGE